jgi:hypothetical protein
MITPGWKEVIPSFKDVYIEPYGHQSPYRSGIRRRMALKFIYPPGPSGRELYNENYSTLLNDKSIFDILMTILRPMIANELYTGSL